jgi:hypothetical protein
MRARSALLDPADVQGARSEVDLIPVEVDQLGSPQAVWPRPGGPIGCPLAASMSRSTSASVRCSRLRSSAFGRRLGGTVRFRWLAIPARGDGCARYAAACPQQTRRRTAARLEEVAALRSRVVGDATKPLGSALGAFISDGAPLPVPPRAFSISACEAFTRSDRSERSVSRLGSR